MMSRRIWSPLRRWSFPCVSHSFSASPASLPSQQNLPFRRFSSGCSSSSSTSALASFRFAKASDYIDFNIQYGKRYFFSTQPVSDIPVCEIVDVPLAQTGEGIAECELLKWFVQQGDQVEEFQPLCEVQSDKATIEITSRYKGKVSKMLYIPGDIVKVGETLLQILVNESASSTMAFGDSENATSSYFDNEKDGRVLKEDVLNFAVKKGVIEDPSIPLNAEYGEQTQVVEGNNLDRATKFGLPPEDRILLLRGFQRTMVKTMSMAAKVPHFHYVDEINCNALVELKTSFQHNNPYPDVKHTFLPLLIKSLSMALTDYPLMNSCFNEDSLEVVLKGSHNIGIAMATPNGLVVPNIKNVQSLSILEITRELSRLQQLAADNKLNPEDVCDGTITLSNIGAIGGKFGSPLVNIPEVSIIAMGRIQKVPQFAEDDSVYPVALMTVNIGADHRVLDGATVARFCNQWKKLIENLELLILHLR